MIEIGDFYINRRSKDRVRTKLNAQYFIKKKSAQYIECKVVNLSRTGAAVSVPLTEKPERGNLMYLDIYMPRSLIHLSAVGEIKRIEKTGGDLICGIKFNELMSQQMFEQLTR